MRDLQLYCGTCDKLIEIPVELDGNRALYQTPTTCEHCDEVIHRPQLDELAEQAIEAVTDHYADLADDYRDRMKYGD